MLSDLAAEQSSSAKLQGDLEASQSELEAQRSLHSKALSELAAEQSKLQGDLEASQSELEAQRIRHSEALSELAAEKSKLQGDLEASQSELEAQRIRHSEALSDLAAERSKLQGDLETSQSELEAQRSLYSKTFSELAVERASLESAHSQLKAQEAELEQLREELAKAAILSSMGDSVLDASLWERYYGAVGSVPSPPSGIDQILNRPCPFWRGKQVKETHLLALIPSHVGGKALTLDYLGELIKSPKGDGRKTQYRGDWYAKYVRPVIGHQSSDSSYWVLMTKDVLPWSRSKSYQDQCALVADHANRTGLAYEVPGALEAAVVMLLHHVRSGERLYSDRTWTRCRDKDKYGDPVVVGGFASGGLSVSDNSFVHYFNGVSALRKF